MAKITLWDYIKNIFSFDPEPNEKYKNIISDYWEKFTARVIAGEDWLDVYKDMMDHPRNKYCGFPHYFANQMHILELNKIMSKLNQ